MHAYLHTPKRIVVVHSSEAFVASCMYAVPYHGCCHIAQTRWGCCLDQTRNISVIASSTTNYAASGMRCNADAPVFSAPSAVVVVACPAMTGVRYITVVRLGITSVLSMSEIQVHRHGGCCHGHLILCFTPVEPEASWACIFHPCHPLLSQAAEADRPHNLCCAVQNCPSILCSLPVRTAVRCAVP